MKRLIAGACLAAIALVSSGCSSYQIVTSSPNQGKVYVNKTTWYIIFLDSAAYECDAVGSDIKNCKRINFE